MDIITSINVPFYFFGRFTINNIVEFGEVQFVRNMQILYNKMKLYLYGHVVKKLN